MQNSRGAVEPRSCGGSSTRRRPRRRWFSRLPHYAGGVGAARRSPPRQVSRPRPSAVSSYGASGSTASRRSNRPSRYGALRTRAPRRAHPHRYQEARPDRGHRPKQPSDPRPGVGWELVHVCIDDASRIAFAQVMADEKKQSAVAFLNAALAYPLLSAATHLSTRQTGLSPRWLHDDAPPHSQRRADTAWWASRPLRRRRRLSLPSPVPGPVRRRVRARCEIRISVKVRSGRFGATDS